MIICNGSDEEMLSHVDISLDGCSSSIILLFPTTWSRRLLRIDTRPPLIFMLISLITTLRASFLLVFFLLARTNIFCSYNFSFTPDLICLAFVGEDEAQIAKGTRLILYKTNRLVIVISLALSSKSMGTNSKTLTFFSYTFHWY